MSRYDLFGVPLGSPGTYLSIFPSQMEETDLGPEKCSAKERVRIEEGKEPQATVDTKNNHAKFKKGDREPDVDTGNELCKNCAKLGNEIQRIKEDNRQLLDGAMRTSGRTIEDLQDKVKKLEEEKLHVEALYMQMKQRSDAITETMADVFESKGELENVNDEFSNTKLAKRLEGIYNNAWTSLTEWLDDNITELDELDRIKHLTALMKRAYEICASIADNEIRVFLVVPNGEPIPSVREDPLLYKVRRGHGQTDRKRKAIKENVWQMLVKEDGIKQLFPGEDTEHYSEGKEKLKELFMDFIDCCWLLSISHPKVSLCFDVIGKLYEGSIRDKFRRYSCQDTVIDRTKVKDTIVEVVWPCVELEDGSGIHTKGDLIAVEEGSTE